MSIQSTEFRIQGFRDLKVWQKAMQLTRDTYNYSQYFPKDETYGLRSQLRRSVVSVPSNIAEGSSKRSPGDYIRFLNIAHGSLAEAETQTQLAFDFNYLTSEHYETLLTQMHEVGRMLNGLINSLEKKRAA